MPNSDLIILTGVLKHWDQGESPYNILINRYGILHAFLTCNNRDVLLLIFLPVA